MALSANLFLRQTQSLVMTPQLMQSIQLLQMTHFELTQFIAQEVEKNPLLEFPSNDGEGAANAANPKMASMLISRKMPGRMTVTTTGPRRFPATGMTMAAAPARAG